MKSKSIYHRMYLLRLRVTYQKITFANIRAPTEEANIETKKGYRKLDIEYEMYDLKIVLGNGNAKIGREDILQPTVGNIVRMQQQIKIDSCL